MTAPGILVPSAMKDPRRYKVPYAAPAETAKAQKQPIAIALSVNGEGAWKDEISSLVPGDSALAKIQLTRDGIHFSGFMSGDVWLIWQGTDRTDTGPIMVSGAPPGKL